MLCSLTAWMRAPASIEGNEPYVQELTLTRKGLWLGCDRTWPTHLASQIRGELRWERPYWSTDNCLCQPSKKRRLSLRRREGEAGKVQGVIGKPFDQTPGKRKDRGRCCRCSRQETSCPIKPVTLVPLFLPLRTCSTCMYILHKY